MSVHALHGYYSLIEKVVWDQASTSLGMAHHTCCSKTNSDRPYKA